MIRRRKAERAQQRNQRTTTSRYLDFLDILLDAVDEDGEGLTDREIRHEVDTFMFEGHDTTASGLSFFLLNMATNPVFQEKCREEILDALHDTDDITWEDVAQHRLPYLTQCIKESMRITPPVPLISRSPTRLLQLPDGRDIPKGIWATVNIAACHRDESIWKNPEEFNPDRFTVENSQDRPAHAYIPFSAGPRNCIGQQFAMLEMKTVLAVLLKQFVFELDDSLPPVQPIQELVLHSKQGIWLRVRRYR